MNLWLFFFWLKYILRYRNFYPKFCIPQGANGTFEKLRYFNYISIFLLITLTDMIIYGYVIKWFWKNSRNISKAYLNGLS